MNRRFLQSKNFKVSLLVLLGVFTIAFGLYFFCDKNGCSFFQKGFVYSFNEGQIKIFAEFPEGYKLEVKNRELLDYYLSLPEFKIFSNLEILGKPIKKIIFSFTEEVQPLFIAVSDKGESDYSYDYRLGNGELCLIIQMNKDTLSSDLQRNFVVNFYFLRFIFDQAISGSEINFSSMFDSEDFESFVKNKMEIFELMKIN